MFLPFPDKASSGYIADVSSPARHHDIDQMYRQRTRQYKVRPPGAGHEHLMCGVEDLCMHALGWR